MSVERMVTPGPEGRQGIQGDAGQQGDPGPAGPRGRGLTVGEKTAIFGILLSIVGGGLTLYGKAILAQDTLTRTDESVKRLEAKYQGVSDALIDLKAEVRGLARSLRGKGVGE